MRNPDGATHILRSAEFANLIDVKALRIRAGPLMQSINGIMYVEYGCEPLEVAGAVYDSQDGHRFVTMFAQPGHFALRGGEVKFWIGTPKQISTQKAANSDRTQILIALAQNDSHVMDVLQVITRDPTWQDLYRAYEALRTAIGGHKAVEEIMHRDKRQKKFTETANVARHYRSSSTSQMSPSEGQQFILDLLRAHLEKKGAPSSPYR